MALSTISFIHVLCGGVALIVARVLYELFLSPLKHIPGPFLAKFTDFYRAGLTTQGNVDIITRGWHKRWGPAVRVGPNAISISDPGLIRVIYTTKNPWRKVSKCPLRGTSVGTPTSNAEWLTSAEQHVPPQ